MQIQRQTNIRQLSKFFKVSKTDEQKDLITQVIDHYSSGKIHKLITAEDLIRQALNTKASREAVKRQLSKLEIKEPVNKIVYKTITEQPVVIVEPVKELTTIEKLTQFITIKEQSCVLDGLNCIECPNVEVLDKLLNSDLLNTVKYDKDEFGKQYENERKHLESYKLKVDRNGKVTVVYKKFNLMKYGRVYCVDSLGAISIRKEIRGSLFVDKYVDLDMCNCHPNIYYQIAKLHNIDCPCLEKYILQRETVLEMIMAHYNVERCVAKQLFIRLLYIGGFGTWADEHGITELMIPFIVNLKEEIQQIASKIIENNPKLVKKIQKKFKPTKETPKLLPHKLRSSTIAFLIKKLNVES